MGVNYSKENNDYKEVFETMQSKLKTMIWEIDMYINLDETKEKTSEIQTLKLVYFELRYMAHYTHRLQKGFINFDNDFCFELDHSIDSCVDGVDRYPIIDGYDLRSDFNEIVDFWDDIKDKNEYTKETD